MNSWDEMNVMKMDGMKIDGWDQLNQTKQHEF
jgi:hypothetical protein